MVENSKIYLGLVVDNVSKKIEIRKYLKFKFFEISKIFTNFSEIFNRRSRKFRLQKAVGTFWDVPIILIIQVAVCENCKYALGTLLDGVENSDDLGGLLAKNANMLWEHFVFDLPNFDIVKMDSEVSDFFRMVR